ncbi:MAG: class II glutamine amidotransferase [Gammaproteobacteria bacterium]
MCRWLAYSGSPIALKSLIIEPARSLLIQSRFARENYVEGLPEFPDGAFPTNGDGFGIGWYDRLPTPGVFRESRPAWSDRNLISLAEQIRSPLFFAHLRAAYDGIVQQTNSHPFSYGNWLFQHNGEISGYKEIYRQLRTEVREDLYPYMEGTTDTENCFYLALGFGLETKPKDALLKMVSLIERYRNDAGIEAPFRLTCAATDSHTIHAVRYASHGRQKTLYISNEIEALREIDGGREDIPADARIILSEPLDDCDKHWQAIPENSYVTICDGQVEIDEFSP